MRVHDAQRRVGLIEQALQQVNDENRSIMLQRATDLAMRMVRDYGMSPRLGPVGFSSDGPAYLGGEPVVSRSYAEETQRLIDEEVRHLVAAAHEEVIALLGDNRSKLESVTRRLLDVEVMEGDELRLLLTQQAQDLTPKP